MGGVIAGFYTVITCIVTSRGTIPAVLTSTIMYFDSAHLRKLYKVLVDAHLSKL